MTACVLGVKPPMLTAKFGTTARFPKMLGEAYFLLGDSYPRDAHVAEAVKIRIAHHFTKWVDQNEIMPLRDRTFNHFRRRARAFEHYMAQQCPQGPLILFGRSSGARLASLYGSRSNASAVVCLGYPFLAPDRGPEPERYRHLATTRVPTLIFQGWLDKYGSPDDLSTYSLSPQVSVRPLETTHEMHLSPDTWDQVVSMIVAFLQRCTLPNAHSTASSGRDARAI